MGSSDMQPVGQKHKVTSWLGDCHLKWRALVGLSLEPVRSDAIFRWIGSELSWILGHRGWWCGEKPTRWSCMQNGRVTAIAVACTPYSHSQRWILPREGPGNSTKVSMHSCHFIWPLQPQEKIRTGSVVPIWQMRKLSSRKIKQF